MRRKAGIAVAALILAAQLGSDAAAAPPSLEELATMTAFLEANDVVGLRGFFLLHPELLEGDGSFAVTMRQFMADTEDMSSYLAFEPDIRDAVDTVEPGPLRIEVGPPEEPQPQPAPGVDPDPEPEPEGPVGY